MQPSTTVALLLSVARVDAFAVGRGFFLQDHGVRLHATPAMQAFFDADDGEADSSFSDEERQRMAERQSMPPLD